MVIPFAIVTGSVPKVSVFRAIGTSFVAHNQVRCDIEMRDLPFGVEMQVGPLQRCVRVRCPVIVMNCVAIPAMKQYTSSHCVNPLQTMAINFVMLSMTMQW